MFGFFNKLVNTLKSFAGEDLEVQLCKIDVHPEVSEKISKEIEKEGKEVLKKYLKEFKIVPKEIPTVVLFFGPNGVGKTTTIWKLANIYKNVVIGACDTFRAGSIEQLKKLCKDFKIISREYGCPPYSVALDTINYAKSKNIQWVFLDSAGRQENIYNLIEELKKLQRISHYNVYVCEATSGKVIYEKTKKLLEWGIKIDCAIITKLDVDEKGGIFLNLGYLGIPISYICFGQDINDIKEFSSDEIMKLF
jgi:fused signal recognition particle receptor